MTYSLLRDCLGSRTFLSPTPEAPLPCHQLISDLEVPHCEHLFGPAFAGSTAHLGGAPTVETWGMGGGPCALWGGEFPSLVPL